MPFPGFDIFTGGGGISASSSASNRTDNTSGPVTFGDYQGDSKGGLLLAAGALVSVVVLVMVLSKGR